jgi:hypothetical protein
MQSATITYIAVCYNYIHCILVVMTGVISACQVHGIILVYLINVCYYFTLSHLEGPTYDYP